MTSKQSETRERILAQAYALFYKKGFARVSVDAIAEAAGVTKRTLYYHYDSKDSLAAAVLTRQQALALAQVQSWGGHTTATPADFLETLFTRLEEWATQPRWLGSGFTRLAVELADLPGHPARQAAHEHRAAVEQWLVGEPGRLGAARPDDLARQVMLLIEGCLSLVMIHGDRSYITAAASAAVALSEIETG